MASSGVSHEPGRGSTRSKGQIGCRVRIRSIGGEVGGRGEVSHSRERRLRLVLAAGVSSLQLVLEGAILLAGGQIVKLLPKVK